MREGCRRALRPRGYQVDTAEHGAEGLHRLREAEYDLVLLDAMMPGMSGLEILSHIQEHYPDTVCVMITGYATVGLATEAMQKGAQGFLPKPFTSDELHTRVLGALEERNRRRATRQLADQEEESRLLERTHAERARLDAFESRFMLVLVHELRNPAGAIRNHVQLMRAGYVEEGEWDEYLERVDLRAGQLLAMLDELLELAHLKEIERPRATAPIALAELVEGVASKFRPVAEAKGLSFEVRIQQRPAFAADPVHMESLWSKLVDNAIRYTPHGFVRLSLDVDNGLIVGTVADSGIGLSDEDLTRIYQDFYRADAARAEVELGTGLGLPIVCRILEIYGGSIQVESTPGQGSTFTVRLPVSRSGLPARP